MKHLSLLRPLQLARLVAVPTLRASLICYQSLCLPVSGPGTVSGGRRQEERGGEGGGGEGGQGRGGGWRRKCHSLVHSHQIRERAAHTTSLFQALLGPHFHFGSLPSGLGIAQLVGWAGAGTQVPSQTGLSAGSIAGLAGSLAVTRHALLLVREASPSCFPSFITVLFVVQQIKFFCRLGGGGDGGAG